jgi:transcriptional regulator with PAS, ATPase and Fis domain
MVNAGKFREDLYYRIKVLNLSLPALRVRKGDIPLLCDHFITLFNARYKKNIREVSHETLDLLLAYDFPGNIRELENVLEHAFTFCKCQTIEPQHLPQEITIVEGTGVSGNGAFSNIGSFEELEKRFIESMLAECGGSRIKTAQRLGIHKATLFRKMKALGIEDA